MILPSLERNQAPFHFLILLFPSQLRKKCIRRYESLLKIQHNTSPFHFKKIHNTSYLGTCKASLLIFFETIVNFHCLTLI